MNDPDRLLHRAGSPEARLLAAGLDEPPPSDLLERTVAAAGSAGAAAGAAASAPVAAAKGGLLGAVAVGALAGALTVGAFELATMPRAPAPAPPAALTTATAPLPPVSATPPTEPAPPAAQAVATAAPAPGSPRPSTLAAELALLDEARGALRGGEPARAIEALDRFARQIPRAQMAREASVLRAEAEAAIDAGKAIP
jgi:hypothetical protein